MPAPTTELRQRPLEPGPGLAMELLRDGAAPSQAEVLRLWRADAAFTDAFAAALAAAPFEAFLWETPPFARATPARPFEWVLLPSATLAGFTADDRPFAEHVRGERGIRTFDNLGGDARLVVPCAEAEPGAYPHLAAFLRRAPRLQVRAFWSAVAEAVEERLARSSRPLWLSTSGLGVAWVHARIDERPKYFAWAPFREA